MTSKPDVRTSLVTFRKISLSAAFDCYEVLTPELEYGLPKIHSSPFWTLQGLTITEQIYGEGGIDWVAS